MSRSGCAGRDGLVYGFQKYYYGKEKEKETDYLLLKHLLSKIPILI
jgi:hypothetical protein